MAAAVRRFDPTTLGYLGFLAVPGWFVEPLRPLSLFGICFLFWFWPFVSTLWAVGSDAEEPTDWLEMGDRRYYARYVLTLVPTMLNPFVIGASIGQLAGQLAILARYSGRLPGPADRDDAPGYRLPFNGTWTVVNGSVDREQSHSWSMYTQRYAYDFVITDDDGSTHRGDGTANEEYYCFDEPILAPADGVVVEATDGHRDGPRPGGWLDVFQRDIRGNFLTIDHGGEYSVLAHLTPGSIAVAEGDRVERGQAVGRCGNSGNSAEPHLHFHLQDRPSFFLGMGLPVAFDAVEVESPLEGTRDRRDRVFVSAGQRVRHVGEGAEPSDDAGSAGASIRSGDPHRES